jgi:predicted oxidoreductase
MSFPSNKLSSPIAGCMRWGVWGAELDTWQYRAMIELCLESGITSFDHADIYGNYTTEAEFGAALKETPALRKEIQIITKCGIQLPCANRPLYKIKAYNTSYDHIMFSVHQSLENFNTDYIDVLLIHRPDILLNPYEIARAINELKQAGKILQFGVSNFMPPQTNALKKYTTIEYNQLEISIIQLASFANGCLDNCIKHQITPMAWAPLGGGLFTEEDHPTFRNIVNTASALAKYYNTGINQILIAFLLKHPAGIIPVLGTTKIDRLIQSKEAAQIPLTHEDWYRLYLASNGEELA